jgi:multisubunit Na+/H+ antiporter MnhF subunit
MWEALGSFSIWAVIVWAWLCSLFFVIFGTNVFSRIIGLVTLAVTILGTIHYIGVSG